MEKRNVITVGRTTILSTFFRQFASPFDGLLLAVAILAFALHEATDAAIVLTIVGVSAVLGTRNEYSAEKLLEKLRARITRQASVVRDGVTKRIDVADLVPGDVISLSLGDAVPADLQVRSSEGLECDESTLTGESRPVAKDAGSEAFMGTSVSGGRGHGVVVAIGPDTRFGTIAVRAAHRPPPTAFEIGLTRFSALLLYITLAISLSVFGAGLLLHRPLAESLLFTLAISVSLTPQMLPVIVSISLSVGASRMAKRGAIVKRLISIEDVGNIAILFTDKTGTLTTGDLTLQTAVDVEDRASDDVMLYGLLCNDAGRGDPGATVNALDSALWADVSPELRARAGTCKRLGEVPFDYERRAMSVVALLGSETILILKGAPEAVFARCDNVDPEARKRIDRYSEGGARVIAVAVRDFTGDRPPHEGDERNLHYAGALVFADPPKPGVKEALEQLARLGIRVKVVTGDSERAARALCERVGLAIRGSLSGDEIDRIDDAALLTRLQDIDLFARISPLQKERIVRAQRRSGLDVGFLGDGVNDVLALRAADAGITVDSAADVAKDASDVVLLSKDLAILAAGVLEGRRIFANTMKYVLMATSSNFGNMISTAAGSMILPFLPLLPSQVLLNNLLYDVSEMTIPSDNVDPETIAAPSHWNIAFVRRFMLAFGPFSALSDFVMFAFLLYVAHAPPAMFRSGFFMETFGTQALTVFVLRTRHVPFFRSRPAVQLALTTAACAAIGIALPFSPLAELLGFAAVPPLVGAAVGVIVVLYIGAIEYTKYVFFRRGLNAVG